MSLRAQILAALKVWKPDTTVSLPSNWARMTSSHLQFTLLFQVSLLLASHSQSKEGLFW